VSIYTFEFWQCLQYFNAQFSGYVHLHGNGHGNEHGNGHGNGDGHGQGYGHSHIDHFHVPIHVHLNYHVPASILTHEHEQDHANYANSDEPVVYFYPCVIIIIIRRILVIKNCDDLSAVQWPRFMEYHDVANTTTLVNMSCCRNLQDIMRYHDLVCACSDSNSWVIMIIYNFFVVKSQMATSSMISSEQAEQRKNKKKEKCRLHRSHQQNRF
jgi:hypothetical protein